MNNRVRTAIFPVAGQGTRLLPATKSVPKELLPVFDTPLLQFAIEEALGAGVERLVFVSHPSKAAIRDFLSEKPELASGLRAKGKHDLAASVELIGPGGPEVVFTMQPAPRGLGHAVLCARDHALPGPVAVILPDDLILGRPCIAEMAEAYAGGHLVATMEVAPTEVTKYGMLDPRRDDGTVGGRVVPASGIVEKPALGTAPSLLAAVGRYVLDASIFEDLARTRPGAGGEIQLTDAMAAGASRVGLERLPFLGHPPRLRHAGRPAWRFDCLP
jgi:UTP--glucose-1-phosphate uridylyltransferase